MEVIYCLPDCVLSPTCFFSNCQWNFMCYYTKVYFNIIPTIHKKYRKQNKQPKRKLIRQIILEINTAGTTTLKQRWKLVVTLNNQNSTLFQRYNFYVEFATLNLRWYYVVGTTLKTATLFQRWTFNLLSSKGMNY